MPENAVTVPNPLALFRQLHSLKADELIPPGLQWIHIQADGPILDPAGVRRALFIAGAVPFLAFDESIVDGIVYLGAPRRLDAVLDALSFALRLQGNHVLGIRFQPIDPLAVAGTLAERLLAAWGVAPW